MGKLLHKSVTIVHIISPSTVTPMLMTENLTTEETLALINTDYEPIHIPGAIQAHGLLFVLRIPDLTILQVSSNTSAILGIKPEKILGKKISHIISKKKAELIKQGLKPTLETINPFNISINTSQGKIFCDAIIHREQNTIILELELINNKYNKDFFSFYHLIKTPIINLQKAPTLNKLYQVIIKEIRNLTEFDRVMVYKFGHDSSGVVIAEDKLTDLEPLLGLNYPSFEIPLLSRHLFSKNSLRFIPDTNYQAVPIIPQENPLTKEPLDMSLCVLRSVSNCHIEYLKNMGVSASFVISLMRNDELWGLIACHNYTPKYLPYELRTACEILCKIMALEIGAKEDNENLDYQIKLKAIQAKFVEEIAQTDDFVQGLIKDRESLLELVSAEGAVIYHKNNFICIGNTPEIADIVNLVKWLENQLENDIFSTSFLPKLYPEAEKFKNVGSGLLALAISKLPKNYILWFRPEVIQAVNWAGEPQINLEHKEEGILKLTPRKSFQLWKESVKFQSLPWRECEIDIALELRVAIVGIVLRKSEQLEKINQQLTLALEAGQMVIWDWDLQNNYVVWSNGYQQLFGLKPENPITNYDLLLNSIYYADRERIRLELHQAQIDKTDYHQECRVIWGDQTIHWIESKGKYFYDEQGKAIRMLGTVIEISDRKQAELALIEAKQELEIKVTERTAKLKESEEKFRQLAENIQEVFWLFTPEPNQLIYISPAFDEIWGRNRTDIYTDFTEWFKAIHPGDRDRVETAFSHKLLAGLYDEEYRIIRGNGHIRWIRDRGFPIKENDGEILRVAGIAEDITARKLAQEALQHREQQLKTLTENIPDIITRYNREMRCLYVNAAIEKDLGLAPETLIGKNLFDSGLNPEFCEKFAQWLKEVFTTGEKTVKQFDYMSKKGLKFYQALLVPETGIDNQINSILTVTRDITDIKKTEAALRDSEAKFRLLTEFSPLGIFLLDKNGKCTYTNPRSHAICGYTFNEALEDGWLNFIHPEDLEDLMIKWQQNLNEKTFDIYEEVRYLHKNGTIHYGRVQIAPIFDHDNNIKAYVGTVEDITQRYEIEKMKREFISIVSHELRTPLTSIRGSLGLLASGILNSRPEKIQEMLKIASGDTERLVRLVNDILDLERLESHKIKLDKKSCSAFNLVHKSIETVSSLALESNINLSIPENIDNNLQIWADPDRIIQTLVNLISNAIKFSPSDTTITVNITDLADKILFSVQDQGRGIPEEKIETIFGKFQQVDASDSREKGGTGLGLAICRNIIQQHGGKIWAESELGKGSTFYFTIPIPLD